MRRFFGLGPRLAPDEDPSRWELEQNKPQLKPLLQLHESWNTKA